MSIDFVVGLWLGYGSTIHVPHYRCAKSAGREDCQLSYQVVAVWLPYATAFIVRYRTAASFERKLAFLMRIGDDYSVHEQTFCGC